VELGRHPGQHPLAHRVDVVAQRVEFFGIGQRHRDAVGDAFQFIQLVEQVLALAGVNSFN
jgi:hypothetical protein